MVECLDAIDAGNGAPCNNCRCTLEYHIVSRRGVCQFCGCDTLAPKSKLFTVDKPSRFIGIISARCTRCMRVKLLTEFGKSGKPLRPVADWCRNCNREEYIKSAHCIVAPGEDYPFIESSEPGDRFGRPRNESWQGRSAAAYKVLEELTE